jgi:hypothetical protein
MKKSPLVGVLSAVLFAFIATSANATLVSRLGGQAAYDDVLGITWLTTADVSGTNAWANQLSWIDSLNTADYLGFNDWRLASMSVAAGLPTGTTTSVVDCSSATELACRDNELGYMFYHNMGGAFSDDKSGNQTVDGVLLTGIQPYTWAGTEYDSSVAWLFYFGGGDQFNDLKDVNIYGWAVRTGDVPVPPAVWLFISGLCVLVWTVRRKTSI